ncbi:hypothetical protein [Pseudomonas phage vB_PseuGesM_254]|uniref:Uncharacterized protein n=1 Tax=Pseudomonas phage vB_PseuGesM_254 TaxID=3092638 RepID=A0AAX4G7R8_9CAUD|nr:hypothetical protein [Pseudomonas phage PseuGes_254]
MRIVESITCYIDFETKHLSQQNIFSLHKEVLLFCHAWPSARVDLNVDQGVFAITYKDHSNQRHACLDAADMFQDNVRRFTWWKEK